MNARAFPRPASRAFASVVLAALLWPGLSHAADPTRLEDPDVRACAERALPESALSQSLTVQAIDRTDTARVSKGKLHWKRFDDGLSRILVRLSEPPGSAGLAVLMLERDEGDPDVYMYIPEARRTRRMTSGALAGRMLGTDFSYEDFAFFQQLSKTGSMTRLADSDLDGHAVYVLETMPDDETSDYSRILTYLDQALCLPMRTEFFAPDGGLHKELVLEREHVREVQGRQVPFRSVMIDHRQESRSILEVTKVELDPELRDTFFSPTSLRQGH